MTARSVRLAVACQAATGSDAPGRPPSVTGSMPAVSWARTTASTSASARRIRGQRRTRQRAQERGEHRSSPAIRRIGPSLRRARLHPAGPGTVAGRWSWVGLLRWHAPRTTGRASRSRGVDTRMTQPEPAPAPAPVPGDAGRAGRRPPDRIDLRHAVARYVPIVTWLPAYDRADLRFDAIAGIVSWGVMVPVAMAYAGLAGMPPETGLVTAFARDDRVRHLRHVTPPQGHRQLVGGDHVGVGRGRDRRRQRERVRPAERGAGPDGRDHPPGGRRRPARLPLAVPRGVGGHRLRDRAGGHHHRRPDPGPARDPVGERHDHREAGPDRREPGRARTRTRPRSGSARWSGSSPSGASRRASRVRSSRSSSGSSCRACSTCPRRASPSSARWPPASRCRACPSIGFGDIVFLLDRRVRDRLPRARRIDRGRALLRGPPPLRHRPGPGAHRPRRVERRGRPVRWVRGRCQPEPVRDRRSGRQPDPALVAGDGRPDPRHRDRPCPDLREPAAVGPVRDRDRLGREPGQPGRAATLLGLEANRLPAGDHAPLAA